MTAEKIEQQLQIEKEANDYSQSRLLRIVQDRVDKGRADELTEGKVILYHALDTVTKKIEEYFKLPLKGRMATVRDYVLPDYHDSPKELAYILLVTIVRTIGKEPHIKGTKLVSIINSSISRAIYLKRLNENATKLDRFIEEKYSHKSKPYREKIKVKLSRQQEILQDRELAPTTTSLGAILIDLLVKSNVDIIEKKIVYERGRPLIVFCYTTTCFRMVLQSRERLLLDYTKYPIFVVPPVDWDSFKGTGGYYNKDLYSNTIIKTTKMTYGLLKKYFKAKDPTQLYSTLNILQRTPWRVNRRVYDVMNYVFRNNLLDDECPTNNPYLVGKLPYGDLMEASDFISPYSYGEVWTDGKYKGLPKEKEKMIKYFNDIEEQNKIIQSTQGKALMLNLILDTASQYINEPEIYFSYQYDFRGRIYPIQQHLQPQGDGRNKALLEFANGYPIEDDEDLFWFLVHGANCYGFDKESYEDRIKHIKEKHNEILAIAADPIKERLLWKDTDEPYLFLAWCFEYADYISNPNEFLSHIPIALDATCSGIQIYSGLLLDAEGAEAVNVIGDTRNDIYQRVADKVNSYLDKGEYPREISYTTSDGEEVKVDTARLVASIKGGKITRKLTKRNTMTQPYSVTSFGMYEQLKDELKEIESMGGKFWDSDNWVFAKLLAVLNDRAITETVKGARIGQNYLKEVTSDVVSKGEFVFYTTPITEFPVLQKVHKTKFDRVTTPIGILNIRRFTNELHPGKMVNGIAPNYIHSLDSTLLAMTIIKLWQDGVRDFHVIHDSYGVPVSSVKLLHKRVKEAYVELFKAEPLRRWLAQVCKNYPTQVDDIMVNTLNLDDVLKSKYIFS